MENPISPGLLEGAQTSLQRTDGTKHNHLIQRNGIPPIIVAGMLGHSLSILMTSYAHYIPGTQNEAARLINEILPPILIDLNNPS